MNGDHVVSRPWRRLWVSLFALLWCGAVQQVKAEPVKDSARVILGYYPAWITETHPPAAIHYEHFTHIAHAFLLAKADGTPIRTERVPSRELTAAAHAAGVRVILSLGGAGSHRFYGPMIQDNNAVQRHLREVMKVVEEFDYDGLDLDWEGLASAEDREAFSVLARGFREGLDRLGKQRGRRYELTAAVGASSWSGQWFDEVVLRETMDFLNIMTYDFTGPWGDHASHQSPLHSDTCYSEKAWQSTESSMKYWWKERNIPLEKLNVGIPLYGRGFETACAFDPNPTKGKEGRWSGLGYAELAALLKSGWRRAWDEKAKVPWLFAPDQSVVVGYDDAESVTEKTRWAKNAGYRGIFFWAIGHDLMPDGSQPLVQAAADAWPRTDGKSAGGGTGKDEVMIRNGSVWKDTDGEEIWCNGGHMIREDGTFYWVGYETGPQRGAAIKLYSSIDLVSWTFRGNLLNRQGPLAEVGWTGRPALLHNKKSGRYVLVFEADNRNWFRHKVGFASSRMIDGEYRFEGFEYPEPERSTGDQSVYQEGDDAYLVTVLDSAGLTKPLNVTEAIYRLTPDFLHVGEKIFEGFDRRQPGVPGTEASHIIKVKGTYYWFMSGLVGWNSSPTRYATTAALAGPWSDLRLLPTVPESPNSFNTQHDFVIPVEGRASTTYLYVGDRYSQWHGMGEGRNIFLPLDFKGEVPKLIWRDAWRIDTTTGQSFKQQRQQKGSERDW